MTNRPSAAFALLLVPLVAMSLAAACSSQTIVIVNGDDAGADIDAPDVIDTGVEGPSCATFQTACGSHCVDLESDPASCGACGHVCPPGAFGTPLCSVGQCSFVCAANHQDCDQNPANGCETDIATDPNNCGACRQLCAIPHGQPSCVGAGCHIASCDPGFTDCDGMVSNGCETNIAGDPANCGICNNACSGGGACAGGACVVCASGQIACSTGCTDTQQDPANCGTCGVGCTGATPACLAGVCGPGPVVLASKLTQPASVAVDGTNVYFALDASPGSVWQLPKSGGTMAALGSSEGGPSQLLADGSHLYWYDTSGLVRVSPVGSATPTTLATVQLGPMVANATTLFWVTQTGAVQSMPKAGGTPTPLGTAATNAYPAALDASYFYFAAGTTVSRIPLAGGAAAVVGSTGQLDGLAVDAARAYVTTNTGTIESFPIAGGAATVLATGLGAPQELAVDSGNLYFVDYQTAYGRILRMSVAGGTPQVLASMQAGPRSIAVDATNVYWVNDIGGTVMTIGK